MNANNSWADKARALDRYRWRLLRERHGVLGSALRFVRDGVQDALFGLAARLRSAADPAAEPCDFLLLQSSPKVILLQRKKLLIAALRARGHTLTEVALPEVRDLVAARMLARPPQRVPLRYFGYAAHAAWLVRRYQPRILLNDRNGSLYAPFLRLALHEQGRTLVHLAHSTTVEGSRRLGMNDYDYYFLFGRSSLEALQARALRFGTSTAVLAGSHMIDESYRLPAPDPRKKTLLVLGLGPDKEKVPDYLATYALLRDWAAQHPAYRVLVKAHPRSKMSFWQETARALPSVTVLPPQCTLAEALAMASVVVNIVSNAVIEAALAARPLLYVNCGHAPDVLAQEQFFGARIATLAALEGAMQKLEQDYAGHCARSAAFVEYHLASGADGLACNLRLLKRLLAGQPPDIDCVAIDGSC